MDFITDLPRVSDHVTMLVIVGRFSKMAHFFPCSKTISGEETADLFLENGVQLQGLPKDITPACHLYTILKLMDKPKESTKSSNNTSGVQSATNKKIGWISFPWWNLPTIIVSMPQLRFPHSLQTTVSTLVSTFPLQRFPSICRPRCVPTLYQMFIVTSPLISVPLANNIKLTLIDIAWSCQPS